MLTHTKIQAKLDLILGHYKKLRFIDHVDLEMEFWQTKKHFRKEPSTKDGAKFRSVAKGTKWGGSWVSAWFRADFKVPKSLDGKKVFLRFPNGTESLLIVDDVYKGTFNLQHPLILILPKAKAGSSHHIALDAYAGHSFPGTMPHDAPTVIENNAQEFRGAFLCEEREDVTAFIIDVEILLKLVKVLDNNSLRKGQLLNCLQEVWSLIPAMPQEHSEEEWRAAIAKARKVMAPYLAKKNSESAPEIHVVAHSHIDTAWLWNIAETRRKCGRTFSSMVNLMQRYPEVVFLQSAPCHADFVRQDYPEIFEDIKKLVKKGTWEPNGGAWIEPDCNLTSGEALIRQFLHGILWTREHYGYSSDTLWQPDVFGYSAALPQILQKCGIKYFCTTKMAWNDTTRFPYDTFQWQGIDGSTVLTHLNSLPQFIDSDEVVNLWNWAQHKDSEDKRLASYGWGDGGGGPTSEDMEKVRRLEDLEGAPRVRYTTVTQFMDSLSTRTDSWPKWVGELYLELHRGTLTSVAAIKRGNRKTELALRDAEFTNTLAALNGTAWPKDQFLSTWRELLINQFHDILPGTSIAEANDDAIASFEKLAKETKSLIERGASAVAGKPSGENYLLFNSLSWTRNDVVAISNAEKGLVPANNDLSTQRITNLDGADQLLVGGLSIASMSAIRLDLRQGRSKKADSPFVYTESSVKTPHGTIRFDKKGAIKSYTLNTGREVVRAGGSLNTFYLGEDIPQVWDQWDIDADQELMMKPDMRLKSRKVIADGPLQMRIRSVYTIGKSSELTQDMILHANSPEITFDTKVEWADTHKLLKVGFEIDVQSEMAKHEIQFGHVERPTHRNYIQDRARFEVCCHKWADLSDNGFGVAILNDCKYGISVLGSEMRLSLIKSGTHPDPRADHGTHRFVYSILPHEGPFSVEAVVRPAYELNIPTIVQPSAADAAGLESLVTISTSNVILESIKWAEEQDAIIVRLYEAGRMKTQTSISFGFPIATISEASMLEEETKKLNSKGGSVELTFSPFEIKTLLVKLK